MIATAASLRRVWANVVGCRTVPTLFRLATLLTLLAMLPGAREVLEQAGHFAVSGHSSHASEHPEGNTDSTEEHGCTGATHVCHCCRIPVVAPTTPADSASLASVRMSTVAWQLSRGVTSQLLRPPLA